MRSKLFKIFSVLVAVIIVFSCFCIAVGASTVYKLSINQPLADEYSGYIEYLIQTTNGTILPFVTFWHITGSTPTTNIDVSIPKVDVTVSENRILLSATYISSSDINDWYFKVSGGSVNGYGGVSYWSYGSGGNNYVNWNGYIGTGTVLSYKIYGNFDRESSSISAGTMNWDISYSETSILYDAILIMADSISGSNSAIIENATENADKIQQNQNENTDKLLNGDEDLDSSGETDKVDGTIGGIDDATDSALGGKSDEDIQNEVSGALDTDDLDIDWTKANRMSTFYDRCLKAFGSEYSTLLLLSLILGLSAFLIGRRYG